MRQDAPANTMDTTFRYTCVCSYPYGPHELHCVIKNDMRLEATCQQLRDTGKNEEADQLWDAALDILVLLPSLE